MRRSPKVSVIMPVYNSEKYLRESIQSVIKQTYTNFELILVNDESIDCSLQICYEYQLCDVRIRVINIRHSGTSHARNIGLKVASGKYLSFLDIDDRWEPTFLEELIALLDKNPNIDFVYSGSDELDKNRNVINVQENYKVGKFNIYIYKSGELRIPFNMDSFIVRRNLIIRYKINFPEGYKISEDICFFLKILCVVPAYYVPKVLTHYCRHDDSTTTSSWSARKWESTVLIFRDVEKYCIKYAPDLKKDFDIIRSYRAYRFVLSVLKQRNIKDSLIYINKFQDELNLFIKVGRKVNDRVKCRLILTKNKAVLKILSLI